ncbi:capsid protein [Weissella viridescens]|uniref:phage tail tube protein n=1 Tax=Weissella viridescens TaxID=1629 RepID=UPI001D06A82A|nr:capsid protein [Weissella viridescens]MCB6839940.1 capsid protein [Weissella viridescens]MCB6846672.1 capsid protein [Weissella viridescens]
MVAIAPVTNTNLAKNYDNILEIDVKGHKTLDDVNEADFKALSIGISTVTPSAQETSETNYFWAGRGTAETDTPAKTVQYTFAGKRSLGDPAQEFVDDKFLKVGDALKTLVRITDFNTGKTIFAIASIGSPVGFGGNANASATFSGVLKIDGMPWLVKPGADVIELNDESTTPFPTKGLPFHPALDRSKPSTGGVTATTPASKA